MNKICMKPYTASDELRTYQQLPSGTCPVKQVIHLLQKAREESCGLGVFCRDGLAQLSQICHDAATGHGRGEADLALIREICEMILITQECDLGVSVAERVLASVTSQTEEWLLHLERSLCSSLQCYYTLYIAPDVCTGCTACLSVCNSGAIRGSDGMIHIIDPETCTKCQTCIGVCPSGSILRAGLIRPRCPSVPVPVGSFTAESSIRRRRRRK